MKEYDNKINCEQNYKERLLSQFKEGSMLWKFYNFLFKTKSKGRKQQ